MSSAMLEESTCDTTCHDDTSALTLSSLGMLLASVPLAYFVLLPLLSRLVGTTLAWYLRRRSSGRRAFLLNLQQEDQRRLEKEAARAAQLRADDGWEKIDSQPARATGTAEVKGENGWAGIIGFFHPFWYVVFTCFCLRPNPQMPGHGGLTYVQ